jgi:hypothetical protein
MGPRTVECLRCGHPRPAVPAARGRDEGSACPRCGYVGWADSDDLTERTRRLVRDLPLDRRARMRPF